MAAGDFSASEMYNVKKRIKEMFNSSRGLITDKQPLNSARAVLENQTAEVGETLSGQTNECVGVEIVYHKNDDGTVVNHEDAETDLTDCSIDGTEMETVKRELNPYAPLTTSFKVDGKKCKDMYQKVEEKAKNLSNAMSRLEKTFNEIVATYINGQASPNQYTDTSGTISGNATYFPSNMWTPDLIAELEITRTRNYIYNPVFLNGSNFFNSKFNAQYNELNDDGKDENAKLSHFPSFYWDIFDVDTVAGEKATFVFDADNVVFWNPVQYDHSSPEAMGASNDFTYTYSIPSERLMYNKNGEMVPVRFDIEEQWVCKIKDGHTKKWDLNVRVALRYGLDIGSVDSNGGNGFLKFVNGTP